MIGLGGGGVGCMDGGWWRFYAGVSCRWMEEIATTASDSILY